MKEYEFSDLTEFRTKLGTVNSNKLCEIIVANRYLGIMKDESILCMQELSRRRELGDVFEFEKHIEEAFGSLPKFKMDMKEILTPKLSKMFGIFK